MNRAVWKWWFAIGFCLLAVVLIASGSVVHAQPLGPLFPPTVRDRISGVAAVPPSTRPPAGQRPLGPEVFGGDVLVSPMTLSAQNEPEGAVNKWVDAGGITRFFHNSGANDYRFGDSRCGVYRSIDGGASYVDGGVLPLLAARPDLGVAGDPDLAWSN